MAQLTPDGRVLSSGKGQNGMKRAWSLAQVWVQVDIKAKTDAVRAAKAKVKGGGNG